MAQAELAIVSNEVALSRELKAKNNELALVQRILDLEVDHTLHHTAITHHTTPYHATPRHTTPHHDHTPHHTSH